jgi:hypothetical protein
LRHRSALSSICSMTLPLLRLIHSQRETRADVTVPTASAGCVHAQP